MDRLRNKYKVTKVEGKTDPDAEYFVLRIDKDRHARRALLSYAISVGYENPQLAADLRAWLRLHHENTNSSEVNKKGGDDGN